VNDGGKRREKTDKEAVRTNVYALPKYNGQECTSHWGRIPGLGQILRWDG